MFEDFVLVDRQMSGDAVSIDGQSNLLPDKTSAMPICKQWLYDLGNVGGGNDIVILGNATIRITGNLSA